MKVLYLDLFAGISGDMTLGGFIDLGVDQNILIKELEKLNISDEYRLEIEKANKNGIIGTKVNVILTKNHHDHEHSHDDHHERDHHHEHDHDHNHEHEHHHGRNLIEIEELINKSNLDEEVKELSKRIFLHVAKAEGKVHGKPIEEVHFHEVGATDSIIDIVGTAICFKELNVDKVVATKVHVGSGFVKCEHGIIPVPVPATMEIIKDNKIPFFSRSIGRELVTPTGAAIVAELVDEYSDMPNMEIEKIGYGAGNRDLEIPNMVRFILGDIKKN